MSSRSIEGYGFEPEDFEKLKEIDASLYDDRPMTPDRRRDIANALNYIISKAVAIYDED